MQMTNSCAIPASVETTWQALNDPAFLKDCIAGCEAIEPTGDNEYKVLMAARIGPVSARFTGRMLLEDLQPPRSYAIRFEGQGGAAGFAKGQARVALEPDAANASTTMSYEVQAQVGGKLAQIGARLIDAAARKVADDFFAAFTAKIASLQPAPVAMAAEAPRLAPAAAAGATKGWTAHSARWAAAALAAAGIAWFLATRIG